MKQPRFTFRNIPTNTQLLEHIRKLYRDKIVEVARAHPEQSFSEIGYLFHISGNWVSQICRQAGFKRGRGYQKAKQEVDNV